ncbi:hypothetical protein [Domibacillus iocasae]|uniref:Histidine kinase n=1 Tax=Domibacillus iocasae TaxID=1714016 RepID=A0A1E7DJT6_9BACI|nr:hypothetical protein [Domibacillus iocasae]OES43351.1 hypothetical protein BA724_13960 [Domibacillus iocasae]
MDSKLEKFERLAEKRTVEAIKKIRLLSNLSNKNNYNYTNKHVEKMIGALEKEIRDLKRKFQDDSESKSNVIFKFDKN